MIGEDIYVGPEMITAIAEKLQMEGKDGLEKLTVSELCILNQNKGMILNDEDQAILQAYMTAPRGLAPAEETGTGKGLIMGLLPGALVGFLVAKLFFK